MTTTAVIKVASFDASLEVEDVTKFDINKFKESLATSQEDVDAEDVEVESVSYAINVVYTLPEAMNETSVRHTIAAAQNVAVDNVLASKKTAVRRLTASGRRLAAIWDVNIKTDDASAVDSIATKAEDVQAIQTAAQGLGISDVTVQVSTPPKKKVSVQFKVKSKPNAATVLQTIDTSKLSESLGDKLGVDVQVGTVEFKGVEEEVKSPPTEPEDESDDLIEAGAKALSCFVAFQMALFGAMAGVQL